MRTRYYLYHAQNQLCTKNLSLYTPIQKKIKCHIQILFDMHIKRIRARL